jgi:8-oxo-dGTP pyrophosphatase MutT (NUDIX family)
VLLRHLGADGEPRFFLAQRSRGQKLREEGSWALPGGAVDRDETSLEGALREMEEEIGRRPEGYTVLGRHLYQPIPGWSYVTWAIEVPRQFWRTINNWETAACGWFTIEEMRQLKLQSNFAAAFFSGEGWEDLRDCRLEPIFADELAARQQIAAEREAHRRERRAMMFLLADIFDREDEDELRLGDLAGSGRSGIAFELTDEDLDVDLDAAFLRSDALEAEFEAELLLDRPKAQARNRRRSRRNKSGVRFQAGSRASEVVGRVEEEPFSEDELLDESCGVRAFDF